MYRGYVQELRVLQGLFKCYESYVREIRELHGVIKSTGVTQWAIIEDFDTGVLIGVTREL